MQYSLEIPRRIIAALINFCSTDESRRILGGIHLEIERVSVAVAKVMLTACDGRTLGHYPLENVSIEGGFAAGERHEFTLNFGLILSVTDKFKLLKLVVLKREERTDVSFHGLPEMATLTVPSIQGNFPPYKNVFPTHPPAAIIWAFDPLLLAKFSRASEILTDRMGAELSIVGHLVPGNDCLKNQDYIGAYSVFTSDANFRGVLMPRRSEVIERHFPDFAT